MKKYVCELIRIIKKQPPANLIDFIASSSIIADLAKVKAMLMCLVTIKANSRTWSTGKVTS